jgi:3-(3-hydroxy-phenyl)propionate hydroxylase
MTAEQRFERIGPFVYPRFAATMPALCEGRDSQHHRVAIVGGGPVGLATALGLARFGVKSVVIEADDSVCMGSRAACVSRRSLQIVERLGALTAFMAKGLPWTDGRSFYRDQEVFRFSMPQDPRDKLPPMINLQQYYIEQFLVDAIARANQRAPGTIDIRWATEVEGLQVRDDGSTLDVVNQLGRYRLHADWLIACDGGQSFVRRQLGLALHGTAYEGRYVIIDIQLPSKHPTERRAWFDPPWNRGSTVLMHHQPDDLWRIDYQLRAGLDPEQALQPERVQDFVQRHLDAIGEGQLPWKPVWTSIYRAGAMTLDSYRHGRVLFAGNAAHAMPIFGVRGLNSGFDDADNLAWKLAEVVQGVAPDCLLDSYSEERVQAFHINASSAMRSTEFMSPPSRGFDLFREAALSLAEEHRDVANLINPRQTQAITYTGSRLSSAGDDFAAGPEPGAVLADGPVQGAVAFLTEALAPGFTCLVFGSKGRDVVGAFANAALGRVQTVHIDRYATDGLIDADGSLAHAYDAQDGAVVLVRPDGHVAGRWRRPDLATLQQALARARGGAAIPKHPG